MSTPAITHGRDFFCRHCGAQYVVSYTQVPIADSGSAYCDVYKRKMNAVELFSGTILQAREETRPQNDLKPAAAQ